MGAALCLYRLSVLRTPGHRLRSVWERVSDRDLEQVAAALLCTAPGRGGRRRGGGGGNEARVAQVRAAGVDAGGRLHQGGEGDYSMVREFHAVFKSLTLRP